MENDFLNKTIALAGVHQALQHVQNIAWNGHYSYPEIDICIASLFERNPVNFEQVFGGIENIQSGLNALHSSFTDKHDKQALERARYMVNLMLLSKTVSSNNELGRQVGTTLSLLDEAASDLENQRDYVIERIAQLYQNTISKLKPRIIVYGKPDILNNSDNAAIIRTLLFSGLRSAVLWYQAGGSQLNLLLGKKKYLQTISELKDY